MSVSETSSCTSCPCCLRDFLSYIVSLLSVSETASCTSYRCCLRDFLLYSESVLFLGLPLVQRVRAVCLPLGLPLVQRVPTVCLWDFLLYSESLLSVSGTSYCTASPCCLSLGLPLVQRVPAVCLWDFLCPWLHADRLGTLEPCGKRQPPDHSLSDERGRPQKHRSQAHYLQSLHRQTTP